MTLVNTTTATVYSKPGCVQCDSMKRHLDNKGIDFEMIDITENEGAYNWVVEMGYQGVPVTVIGFEHFQGFDPDRANAAIEKMLA